RADALLVTSNSLFTDRGSQIVALAARYRLPAAYAWRKFVQAGGLVSYGHRPSMRRSKLGVNHNPNTYSTRALRCSLSSGVLTSLLFADGLGPDTIATYCLPPISKVIGGAEKPDPTLTFHSSSSVVSSKAATVPSSSARKTRPPPVASVPL